MLYLIGLGLGDAQDITVKGLEIVKRAKHVYLETYTSILTCGKTALEQFYGKEIIVADREMVEQQADEILKESKDEDVAFLVVGDPLGATTHTDLILRAREQNIKYQVIHNASILSAVGCCGLQLYNFGETVSIVFWEENWKPDSFYDKISSNRKRGLHTLCLLDIKMKEQSTENLIKGRKIYEPPRFMSVSQACSQLIDIYKRKREAGEKYFAYDEETLVVGLARVGWNSQQIKVGPLKDMATVDLGGPLHSIVIVGQMHPLEEEMLKLFTVNCDSPFL